MSGRHWWSQTFANDGCPLIALPHELVGHWSGTQLDYDRACDASSPVGLFSVGSGLMIVMTSPDTMIYEANWLRLKGLSGITLVGWDTWSGDRRKWLLARLARRALGWRRHPRKMTIASGVLLLQHAAGQATDVRLAPADDSACIGQVIPVGVGQVGMLRRASRLMRRAVRPATVASYAAGNRRDSPESIVARLLLIRLACISGD